MCKIHESLLRCPEWYRPGSNLNKTKGEGSRIRLPLVTGLLEGTSKVLIEELPVPVENCKKSFGPRKIYFIPSLQNQWLHLSCSSLTKKLFLFILVLVVVEFFLLGMLILLLLLSCCCCCWVDRCGFVKMFFQLSARQEIHQSFSFILSQLSL